MTERIKLAEKSAKAIRALKDHLRDNSDKKGLLLLLDVIQAQEDLVMEIY